MRTMIMNMMLKIMVNMTDRMVKMMIKFPIFAFCIFALFASHLLHSSYISALLDCNRDDLMQIFYDQMVFISDLVKM